MIGLVLGAGGGAGGQWIRGVLDGLRTTTGFRPEHASTLIGTSIGAIGAAGIGPYSPPDAAVIEQLRAVAAPPPRPTATDLALARVRLVGGRIATMLSRPGDPDPMTWVESIHPETRANVVSVRRFPPNRRVTALASSGDPAREVAASAAIPFGAQPVEIDGAEHVDGAVWSVTNADLASPTELQVLIVIAPLVTTDGGTLVSGLGRRQLAAELRPFASTGVPVLSFAPTSEQYRHRQNRPRHRADGEALARHLTS